METAKGLKELGINVYRAGIWKPRTHPGSFEGVGAEGLRWMQKAKKEYGLKIATEVAYFAPTEDGHEVYYINKVTDAGGIRRGKLCVTDDKETVTIAKDVIVGSVTSNVVGDVLVSGSVWYETYASGSLEEGYKFNAAYYNGKKEKIMIKNISRKTSSEG